MNKHNLKYIKKRNELIYKSISYQSSLLERNSGLNYVKNCKLSIRAKEKLFFRGSNLIDATIQREYQDFRRIILIREGRCLLRDLKMVYEFWILRL
jgi:hypothetical protein